MAITRFKHLVATALLTTLAGISNATTVLIETSAGEIVVNLYDEATPATVTNFLSYVTGENYNDGYFHRLIPGFVVQSGGKYFTDPTDFTSAQTIASKGTVVNEPIYSNVEGTIAMAKMAGDPDSATSEWFINIVDNSCNLDLQNGGFTVFGQVISGMEFMAAIAASKAIEGNYVAVNTITVLDGAADTSASLVSTPVPNTLITGSGENSTSCDTASSGDSGGGAPSGGFLVLMLSLLALGRRTK